MPGGGTHTFLEPYQYEASLGQAQIEAVILPLSKRHDRAGGYKSAAGDLRIRAERVSGVCRSAGRCLYRRPEQSSGNPPPDLRSTRLQPGF